MIKDKISGTAPKGTQDTVLLTVANFNHRRKTPNVSVTSEKRSE